jgi:pimeloyl-ACP methyl ester carboxylesterase
MDGETHDERFRAGNLVLQGIAGGRGPNILVLHDIEYLDTWRPFEEQLTAKSYRVVVPSHPGFGNSERPDWLDSVDDLAYVYFDLLRELGPSHVVGLGLGGWIAAEMAVRSEQHMRSLVLVDSVGIKVGDHLTRDIADTFVMKPRDFLSATWHDPEAGAGVMKLPGVSELTKEEALTVMRNRESAALYGWNPFMHNPKLAGRLERIRVPSLVLWGESDGVVSVDYGRAFARSIPGAEFQTIASAGHYPYLEQPDAFAAAVTSFLQKQAKE